MYANIFGQYIPEPLKEWGWVWWDERRLIDAGVMNVITSQWKTALELLEVIKDDFPSLQALGSSSATVPRRVLKSVHILNMPIILRYSMLEARLLA